MDIHDADYCSLVLIVVGGDGTSTASRLARCASAVRRVAYSLYERTDRRLFASRMDPAVFGLAPDPLELVDLRPHLSGAHWAWERSGPSASSSPSLSDETIAAIRAHDLDVLVVLGAEVIPDELAACARFGAWSLQHGNVHGPPPWPPFLWELYTRSTTSETVLRARLRKPQGDRVLYRSYSPTDAISLYRTRHANYWKAAQFVQRRLRDLDSRGWEYIASLPEFQDDPGPLERPRRPPSNLTVARLLLRLARRLAHRAFATFLHEEKWFVAYRQRRPGGPLPSAMTGFSVLRSGRGRVFADPFVITCGERSYILFEDHGRASGKAVISAVELMDNDRTSQPVLALARDYHLSYPFVFTHNGAVYMIPESMGARRVELYRAVDLPAKWERQAVLVDGIAAADPTLLSHGGKLWLFANVGAEGARIDDELCLFSATSLFGEWTPHPMNPIVSDCRSARPAGSIFTLDGALIRPSQDCSKYYGWRIALNRIETLTARDYREVPVATINPDEARGVLRTHCYNFDRRYETIDGLRVRPRIGLPALRRRP